MPNNDNFGFGKYGPAWFHTDAGRHIYFFTAKSMSDLLAATGWQVTDVGYFSYTRQFGRGWIGRMQRVWDTLYDQPDSGGPRRPRQSDRLVDLVRTLGVPRAGKYDVLRVRCTPSSAP